MDCKRWATSGARIFMTLREEHVELSTKSVDSPGGSTLNEEASIDALERDRLIPLRHPLDENPFVKKMVRNCYAF
jgi:hypothetical protein